MDSKVLATPTPPNLLRGQETTSSERGAGVWAKWHSLRVPSGTPCAAVLELPPGSCRMSPGGAGFGAGAHAAAKWHSLRVSFGRWRDEVSHPPRKRALLPRKRFGGVGGVSAVKWHTQRVPLGRARLPGVSLIDTGWAAWLPFELTAALEALSGGSPARRAFRQQLAAERDEESRERWERFRLVAPSRVDVPIDGDGLTEEECYALLEGLGLVAGNSAAADRARGGRARADARRGRPARAGPHPLGARCGRGDDADRGAAVARRPRSAAATSGATIPARAARARSSSAATAAEPI